MSTSETDKEIGILVDARSNTLKIGEHFGSIVVKLRDSEDLIIIAERISISENLIQVHGIHISFSDGRVFSQEKQSDFADSSVIEYAVRLEKEIIAQFDEGRFLASYPNIVRFLHTTCLIANHPEAKISHISFVIGEILNRPVAISSSDGIFIADRVVIDNSDSVVFYDCIVIKPEKIPSGIQGNDPYEEDPFESISITYEHFTMVPVEKLRFLLLLGEENF